MKRPDVESIRSRTTFELNMWPTGNPHILAKSQEKIVLCNYIELIEKENLALKAAKEAAEAELFKVQHTLTSKPGYIERLEIDEYWKRREKVIQKQHDSLRTLCEEMLVAGRCEMLADKCDYCEAKPTLWNGPHSVCSRHSCQRSYRWATCEPQLYAFMSPTSLQRVAGWFAAEWFWFLSHLCSAMWIIDETGRQHKFACWVYSSGYFWSERARGRL